MDNSNVNTTRPQLTTKELISKNILNKGFFISVILPIVIYCMFDRYNMVLWGSVLSGAWSLGVVIVQYIISKEVNVFAVITTIFLVIGLIGTVISKDPKFYLASPIVYDFLLAAVFGGSVLIGKPLLQALAEYTTKGAFPEELRKKPKYKSAWTILSIAWCILSITQAVLRIILLYYASNETYFTISTIYGSVSTPLLLVFSFWFPKWYWKRKA